MEIWTRVWFLKVFKKNTSSRSKTFNTSSCVRRSKMSCALSKKQYTTKAWFKLATPCITAQVWSHFILDHVDSGAYVSNPVLYLSQNRMWDCCDRKARAACVQSFALASNNRVHMAPSLYYFLFAPHTCGVVLRTHSVSGEPHIQRNASWVVATRYIFLVFPRQRPEIQLFIVLYQLCPTCWPHAAPVQGFVWLSLCLCCSISSLHTWQSVLNLIILNLTFLMQLVLAAFCHICILHLHAVRFPYVHDTLVQNFVLVFWFLLLFH